MDEPELEREQGEGGSGGGTTVRKHAGEGDGQPKLEGGRFIARVRWYTVHRRGPALGIDLGKEAD